jgi:hypothetical protein
MHKIAINFTETVGFYKNRDFSLIRRYTSFVYHGIAFGAWQISFWSVMIRDAMFIVSSS